MHRTDLENLVRVVCEALQETQVLVFGSQAILGTFEYYALPEEATRSIEADLVVIGDGHRQSEAADQVDAVAGEWSPYQTRYGVYAQGIERRTAMLSPGWAERLVPLRSERTNYYTAWCLEVHDLCSSKLLANREKDREFVTALLREELLRVSTVRERILATKVDEERKKRALGFLQAFTGSNDSQVIVPAPFVPGNLETHPARLLPLSDREPDYRDYDLQNQPPGTLWFPRSSSPEHPQRSGDFPRF